MVDTTRIMDLPENVTMQMNPVTRGDGINTTYSPMDIHPNPYGHPPPSAPSMPTPSSNPNPPRNIPNPMMQMQNTVPIHQSLPSRDIPQYTHSMVQDPQVTANYIPPVTPTIHQTAEYMKQYDELNDRKIQAHYHDKQNETTVNNLIERFQLPILVSLLFFIFHMPIVDRYIFKYLYFLDIHKADGNINLNGLILRSVTFGTLLYILMNLVNQFLLL
jgi:hypothetical protein